MDNKIFPKYAKIYNTEIEMVRIRYNGNAAEYFKPCGEWFGKVEYDGGLYKLSYGELSKDINIEKISALDFLKSNSYGYTQLSEKVFKEALKDCGEEPKVSKMRDRVDYFFTHKYSHKKNTKSNHNFRDINFMKLYKVNTRLGSAFAVAETMEEAMQKVKGWLDEHDYGIFQKREVVSVEIIGTEDFVGFPTDVNGYTPLFL